MAIFMVDHGIEQKFGGAGFGARRGKVGRAADQQAHARAGIGSSVSG